MRNATWAQVPGQASVQVQVLVPVLEQVPELDLVLLAKRVMRECLRYCSR